MLNLNLLILILFIFCIQTSSAQECNMQQLERALIPYDTCLNNIMDLLFHRRDDNQQTQLQPFLQRICSMSAQTSLRSCHNMLDQSLSSCLNIDQTNLLSILKSSSWAGLGFVCQNSSRLLTEFREQGRGYECLQAADRGQNECLRRNPILSMYINSYSGEFCQVTQPAGLACLNQAFQFARCSPMASNFLNGYYRALTQATPCGAIGCKCNFVIILLAVCVSILSLKQSN